MVAVERSPSRCASRWTSSQVSGPPFFGEMRLRTRSARISAPPPGSVRWPGVVEAREHAADRQPRHLAICWISGAEKKCGVNAGVAPARLAHEVGVELHGRDGIEPALEQHGRRAAARRRRAILAMTSSTLSV